MKVCPKCGGTDRIQRWSKSGKKDGTRCLSCKQSACKSWYRKSASKGKLRHDRHDIGRMDKLATRCMFQMFGARPCLKKARWRNGEWRACDKHRLRDDVPWVFAVDSRAPWQSPSDKT